MSLIASRLQVKRSTPLISPQNFQLINGRLVAIADNTNNYIQKGYNINDIVYSVIKIITDKIRVAPWSMYQIKDEAAMKALHAMGKRAYWAPRDYGIAKDLHKKAFEKVKDPGKWGELLKYPNDYETFPEYVANICGYQLLTGNGYAWADVLDAGANKGLPNKLWMLPSQFTSVKATDTFPSTITAYQVQLWGAMTFDPTEVMHLKYWNPNWDINGQQLYGQAPLRAALKILNRDNSSLDASTAAFQNEGIKGILHMKNQVGQVDGQQVLGEVKKLKEQMVAEWVGEVNKGKMGLSGYDMGWLPIGLSAEDMQQIENEKWNLRRICNIFGVQSQLLNDPDNKTFANVEDAEKSLTTRCALPALTAFRDNLNRKGQREWGMKPGYIADFDMSVFTELQAETVATARWLQVLMGYGFPLNRALEILNLEKLPNPIYDEGWVTTQMGQPVSEWELNPVDLGLNDPNADPNNNPDNPNPK